MCLLDNKLNMASFKLANFAIFDSIRANYQATEATTAAAQLPRGRQRTNAIRRKEGEK